MPKIYRVLESRLRVLVPALQLSSSFPKDPGGVEYHTVCSPTGAVVTAGGPIEDVTSPGASGGGAPRFPKKQPEQLMKRYQVELL